MIEDELPVGWVRTTLGNLACYINGRAFKPTEWKNSGKKIIRIQNLNNPLASYNYSDQIHDEKYNVKNGDLLFAWSASLGAHIWKGEDAWLNQHIFNVIPKPGVHKSYLYYLLSKITAELYVKAHGSGMVHITKGKFEATETSLPPLNEQKLIVAKIEELFSWLDSGIASLKTAREQLKIYQQAILIDAFEGKLTVQWRKDNPDKLERPEQLLARIQNERVMRYQQQMDEWQQAVNAWEENGKKGKQPSKPKKLKDFISLQAEPLIELPELPEAWVWEKLAFLTTGVEYGTSTKSSESGLVPVIRMGNLQNGSIDWSDLVYTSDLDEIEKYSLRTNDVLFNRTNSPELVGKTAKYKGELRLLDI